MSISDSGEEEGAEGGEASVEDNHGSVDERGRTARGKLGG